jgi:flagellar assembly protein FliH
MAAAQKFMFGRDFAEETARRRGQAPADADDAPEPEPEEEPQPEPEPEPTYAAADLEAARAEAHAEGRAAGLQEGRQAAEAEAEQALTQALERVARGVEALARQEADAREARDRESLELCVGLLRRLFPALARRHGQAEIEQVFQDALERMRDEPRVVVRCADRHLDGLKARVDALAGKLGFEGRIVLLADDTMQPGDARVEWADGGVERDSERLWQDVERAVERALAPPARPAGAASADAGRPAEATAAEATADPEPSPHPAATPDDGRHA